MLSVSSKIHCVLVDDESVSLDILDAYANQCQYLGVFKIFSSSLQALDYINDNDVDLLITDINMPRLNGFELINQINYPIETILISGYPYSAQEIFNSKVFTFLSKPFSYTHFESAISKVYNLSIATKLEEFKKNILGKFEVLSPREKEIFNMVGKNLKNKTIAEMLFISIKTVENTKINIYHKLGLQDCQSLSMLAHLNYLLSTDVL